MLSPFTTEKKKENFSQLPCHYSLLLSLLPSELITIPNLSQFQSQSLFPFLPSPTPVVVFFGPSVVLTSLSLQCSLDGFSYEHYSQDSYISIHP